MAHRDTWPYLSYDDERAAMLVTGGRKARRITEAAWLPEALIDFLDSAGIALQALSPMTSVFGYACDVAEAQLMARRQNEWVVAVSARFPDRFIGNIHVCFSHCGGALPGMLGRADRVWTSRPEARERTATVPSAAAKRLFFDYITHDPALVQFIAETAGLEQIVLGSDFPFAALGESDPIGALERAGFDERRCTQIAHDHGYRVLGCSPFHDRELFRRRDAHVHRCFSSDTLGFHGTRRLGADDALVGQDRHVCK